MSDFGQNYQFYLNLSQTTIDIRTILENDQAQGLFKIEMCSLQILISKGVISDIISGIGHMLLHTYAHPNLTKIQPRYLNFARISISAKINNTSDIHQSQNHIRGISDYAVSH